MKVRMDKARRERGGEGGRKSFAPSVRHERRNVERERVIFAAAPKQLFDKSRDGPLQAHLVLFCGHLGEGEAENSVQVHFGDSGADGLRLNVFETLRHKTTLWDSR